MAPVNAWDFSATGAWRPSPDLGFPILREARKHPRVGFHPSVRTGRKVGHADRAALRVFGFCRDPGTANVEIRAAVGAESESQNVDCVAGRFVGTLDVSDAGRFPDGGIDVTVTPVGFPTDPVTSRYVKDVEPLCAAVQPDPSVAFSPRDGAVHVICTAAQLADLRTSERCGAGATTRCVSGGVTFRLGNNLDLSGWNDWSPLGSTASGWEFTGTFDGDGFHVRNLRRATASDHTGLFGRALNASIRNVHVEAASIVATSESGILVGHVLNPGQLVSLENVYVQGRVERAFGSSTTKLGGVAGGGNGLRARKIRAHVRVLAHEVVTSIGASEASSAGGAIGGLVGELWGGGSGENPSFVDDAEVRGTVVGSMNTGGVIGMEISSAPGLGFYVRKLRFAGEVRGLSRVGGVAGKFVGSGGSGRRYEDLSSDSLAIVAQARGGGVVGSYQAGGNLSRAVARGYVYGLAQAENFGDAGYTHGWVYGWSDRANPQLGRVDL